MPGRARSQAATCGPQTVDRGGPRRRSARPDIECPNRDLAGGPSAAHEPRRAPLHAQAAAEITCKASRAPSASPFSKSPSMQAIWFVT